LILNEFAKGSFHEMFITLEEERRGREEEITLSCVNGTILV
jgi:hypothetical protein